MENENMTIRKATAEEIAKFEKQIEQDRDWYSCKNCAKLGLCDKYTDKWCRKFVFDYNRED